MTTTISDLPNDLLQDIFAFIAMEPSVSFQKRTRSIIDCNTACRRWRAIAMGFGKIWAYLIDWLQGSESWTIELLNRSAPYPLEVGDWERPLHSLFVREMKMAILCALMEHVSRIRVFRIYSVTHGTAQIVGPQLLEKPMPNLQALSLGFTLVYSIPYLNGNAPNLRSLTISRGNSAKETLDDAIGCLSHTTLVELRVEAYMASIDTWIRTLSSGVPNLRWLSLTDALLPAKSFLQSAHHRPAPRLEMLELDESGVTLAADFVYALSLAPGCGIRLDFTRHWQKFGNALPDWEAMSALVLSRIKCWPQGTTNRFLKVIDESTTYSRYVSITNLRDPGAARSLASKGSSSAHCDPPFYFTAPCMDFHPGSKQTSLVSTLLTHFETTLTTTTELDISYNRTEIDFNLPFAPFNYSFFAQLVNLEVLSLGHEAPLYLLPAFMQKSEETEDGQTGLLLPHLRQMRLHLQAQYYSQSESDELEYLQLIQDFLLWRREQAQPIGNIMISPGTFSVLLIRQMIAHLCELDVENGD